MKQPRYAHYIASIMCGNCHIQRKVKIPIFQEIEKQYCPKCGRKELHHPTYFFGINWREIK